MMRAVDMGVEGSFLLLNGFSLNVANIAEIFLVFLEFIGLVSQATKSIKHNAWNDVSKHGSKEDSINGIISETGDLKWLHSLTNSSRNIELQNTVKHCLTSVFFSFISRKYILHIVAEGDCTKHECKYNSHETNINQLWNIESNSLEDISYFGVVAEDIHYVDEVEWWIEECSNEGNDDVDCYSPKLGTEIKRLCRLTTFEYFMELSYFLVYSFFLTEIV